MDNSFSAQQLQEQTQMLSPRMLQSLHVLQMPSTELYDYLMKELEENPVITFDSIDYAEKCRRNSNYFSYDGDETSLAEIVADDSSSPLVSLRIQYAMLKPPLEVERLGYALIYLLDENGYLNYEDVERLAQVSKASLDNLKTAIDLLHSLEPAGVGAFNLRECILLQLERKGLTGSDSWKIAQDYLELLSENKLPQIAKKSGIPLHRVVNAQQLIRTLTPKPLMMEATQKDSGYVAPDIRIFKKETGFSVELNQLSADSIIIDDTYSKIYSETDNETVRTFLSDNMRKARWLRDSIRQRCETLMACATQLLRVQGSFFDWGPEFLVPYSRKEMAEQIGRSESTISRALKGKYVECDWGMFPTDYFFPKPSLESQPTVTKNAIGSGIQSIILAENSQSPLSDEEIMVGLKTLGISVSRRTVAKYRDELGIPSSSRRRVYS